ncbi:MAG: alpha/beta hydrolase [Flavobacteriales bacterium]|nr:alpha/beta hydrolase [Flavobacteriales bacterium]
MFKQTVYKGAKIHYSKKGNGKRTVVLLHGFLENLNVWNDYVSVLAKYNTVYSIDLPGHGQSDCLGYVHTMDDMAGCVKQVLKENKKRKAILVGHSLGGYVALAFGDLYPDALNGLCLFNSTAKPDSPERIKFRDRAIEVVKENHELFIKTAIPNLFIKEKTPAIRGAVRRVLNMALATPKQGIIATLQGMKRRPDRSIILRFSPYPVLCIAGKNDEVVRWRDLKAQSELCDQGEFYLSQKGGHMCFYEDKYPCLKVLEKFIIKCYAVTR